MLVHSPKWLDTGSNAWQMAAATFVGLQSIPGLVILYGGIVKKKWALNSAFMAIYAFAAVMIVWVLWAYNMSFGDQMFPFWGVPPKDALTTLQPKKQRAHGAGDIPEFRHAELAAKGSSPVWKLYYQGSVGGQAAREAEVEVEADQRPLAALGAVVENAGDQFLGLAAGGGIVRLEGHAEAHVAL